MNNDLISREALLKAMEEERRYLLARGQTGAEHIIVHHCFPIIDNAPTIPLPDFKEGYKQAIIDGKTNFSRPQGEWIDHSEDYGYVECPFCERLTSCEGNIDELHFCWKCGAELRKGELYREETCENRFDCPSYQKQNCIGCENCKKGGAE